MKYFFYTENPITRTKLYSGNEDALACMQNSMKDIKTKGKKTHMCIVLLFMLGF